MKPRLSKILIPVALVGAAVGTAVISTRRPATASEGTSAVRTPHVPTRDQVSSSRLDDSRPDPVLSSFRSDDRNSLWEGLSWNGQTPASFAGAKEGEIVTFELADKTKLGGKVFNAIVDADGSQRYGIGFDKPEGTLFVSIDADGTTTADLRMKDALSVYRWQGKGADFVVSRIAISNYLCASVIDDKPAAGFPLAPNGRYVAGATAGAVKAGPVAAIPKYDSRLGAKGCIYLDFDGQAVTGTRWNSSSLPTINAAPSGYSDADVLTTWRVISEDYAPFGVNVTTDEAVFNTYAKNRRMRVIITPTADWYDPAGGVAFLNSFAESNDDPCWVFTLGVGDPDGAGEAGSHEVGHTMGLNHDGRTNPPEEYYTGNALWGPIMGGSYGPQVVQFSKGEYPDANNTEDDLAIIAGTRNGIGYVADDYGNGPANATAIVGNAQGAIDISGLIETTADVDAFSFTTTGGQATITGADPSSDPNLNLSLTLLDSNGNVIMASNPSGNLTASVSQILAAGQYYVLVEGAAEGDFATGGFGDYGSLGPYKLSGSIVGLGGAVVTIVEPMLESFSVTEGNGVYLRATAAGMKTGSVITWRQTNAPAGGIVTFSTPSALATRATFSMPGLYTLQMQVSVSGIVSSDSVNVSVEPTGAVRFYPNRGPSLAITSASEFFTRKGVLSGSANDDGVPAVSMPQPRWEVVSGDVKLITPSSTSTTVEFPTSTASKVLFSATDGQIRTFCEATVKASIETLSAAVTGSTVKYLLPKNNTVDATWRNPAFNDSDWTTATLAMGYHNQRSFATDLVGGTDIKALMYNKAKGIYVRVPFNVPSKAFARGMALKVKYDDGFILYLNGTEIARRNVGGTPAWDSLASTNRPLADVGIVETIDLTPYLNLLQNGNNVVAIHGCNNKINDIEFLIAPQLTIDVAGSPYYKNVVKGSALPAAQLVPTADADGDGILNFVEHAIGRNPFVSSPGPTITADGYGAVQFTLPITAPEDVKYVLERSFDLTTWSTIASKEGTGAWTGDVIIETVSQAVPLNTIRIRDFNSRPSAYYRMTFFLSGPMPASGQ